MTTGFTEEFLELIKGPPFDWASLQRVASDKTHCEPFDLGKLSSGYLDRPMYANHTIPLEYTLLSRGLFFNSEVSGFQYVRENRAEELN